MAKHLDDQRLCFIVEWYEELAARIRQFQFFYFVESMAVEMYDIKCRRLFLRTTLEENDLKVPDLYIGNNIQVCGRMLKIVDFGDEYTRRHVVPMTERTLGMLKPDGVDKLGQVLDLIWQKGYHIVRLRKCRIDRILAMEFYKAHTGKPYLKDLLDAIISGPLVVFEMVGPQVISMWRDTIGPGDPAVARKEAPNSLRAQYGTDIFHNAVHGSKTAEAAAREIEFFFPKLSPMPPNTAEVGNCTCCLVKPTAFKAGHAGKIVMAIMEAGFRVGAVQLISLEKANAEEFLEVYKGVVHEYTAMVTELSSGPCLALELTAPEDAPPIGPAFRQLVGPPDPEIARTLRPRTLRAVFGIDKAKNAVHCTDLEEDGQLEVEYFFRVLDR
ncbi:nucleoside diphosphate kinase homolog 7-like [Babylonia areolata]|uniref:nucleoside diphosphate kinase homolog 7-like n=1 Tax=Babylonia areolata TaxID=304850 RepID=UPI003FD2A21B